METFSTILNKFVEMDQDVWFHNLLIPNMVNAITEVIENVVERFTLEIDEIKSTKDFLLGLIVGSGAFETYLWSLNISSTSYVEIINETTEKIKEFPILWVHLVGSLDKQFEDDCDDDRDSELVLTLSLKVFFEYGCNYDAIVPDKPNLVRILHNYQDETQNTIPHQTVVSKSKEAYNTIQQISYVKMQYNYLTARKKFQARNKTTQAIPIITTGNEYWSHTGQAYVNIVE